LVKVFDTSFPDRSPFISSDGLTLYFDSERPDGTGSRDLFRATRESIGENFENVVELTALNGPQQDAYVSVSPDERFLFFSDWINTPPRAGGLGQVDTWFAARQNADGPFVSVMNIGAPINSTFSDGGFVVSSDWPANGAMVYFASNRNGGPGTPGTSGGTNLWQATWMAILDGDYNGDGTVNAADYVVWRKGLGTTYTEDDYEAWRANFGAESSGMEAGSGAAGYPLGASAELLPAAIPEPSTGVLFVVGAIVATTFLRNCRKCWTSQFQNGKLMP
jgi:hypothetical protein